MRRRRQFGQAAEDGEHLRNQYRGLLMLRGHAAMRRDVLGFCGLTGGDDACDQFFHHCTLGWTFTTPRVLVLLPIVTVIVGAPEPPEIVTAGLAVV